MFCADFQYFYFFCLSEGDILGQFSVDQMDGEWRIFSKTPLNREDTEKYLLRIVASDGKFQTSTEVEILVLDDNDNSPECKQVILYVYMSIRQPLLTQKPQTVRTVWQF